MGLINLAGGLSAAGGAVSKFAGDLALQQQKSNYETQKELLANQLISAREDARTQFTQSQETARTQATIDSRNQRAADVATAKVTAENQAEVDKGSTDIEKAMTPADVATLGSKAPGLSFQQRLGMLPGEEEKAAKESAPLTDVGKLKADLDAGRISAPDYAAALAKATREPASESNPYDNPVEVEINDGQGGTKQVLAQQNKKTGAWATADESRTPLDAGGIRVIKSDVTGGGRVQGQIMRLMGSAKQATAEIKNLVDLPVTASTGWFAGRKQGTGLLAATKEVLTNTVTSQEVQDFNTSMIGMGRALAGLESGGMQPNQSLQDQFSGLALKEGDTNITKMRKLATMRQDAENALDSAITSPILGKEQKAYAVNLMEELRKAVPWAPADVTRLEHSDNPSATLRDFASHTGLAPKAPDSQSAAGLTAKAPAVGTIQDGHKFIGGDPSKPESWEKLP